MTATAADDQLLDRITALTDNAIVMSVLYNLYRRFLNEPSAATKANFAEALAEHLGG